jgi:hypothetical protein
MQRYFINFLFLNGPIIIWISGLDLEVNYEFNFPCCTGFKNSFPPFSLDLCLSIFVLHSWTYAMGFVSLNLFEILLIYLDSMKRD